MSGALTRLALRALGAATPASSDTASSLRPRLPARFAPAAEEPPGITTTADAETGPPEVSAPAPAPRHATLNPVADDLRTVAPGPLAGGTQAPLADRTAPPALAPPRVAATQAASIPVAQPAVPVPTPAAAPRGPAPAVSAWPEGAIRPDAAPAEHVPTAAAATRGAPPPALLGEQSPAEPPLPRIVPAPPGFLPGVPGQAASAEAVQPPEIVIHIGRIDVAQPVPAPHRSPAAAVPRRSGLGDYLRGRQPPG